MRRTSDSDAGRNKPCEVIRLRHYNINLPEEKAVIKSPDDSGRRGGGCWSLTMKHCLISIRRP